MRHIQVGNKSVDYPDESTRARIEAGRQRLRETVLNFRTNIIREGRSDMGTASIVTQGFDNYVLLVEKEAVAHFTRKDIEAEIGAHSNERAYATKILNDKGYGIYRWDRVSPRVQSSSIGRLTASPDEVRSPANAPSRGRAALALVKSPLVVSSIATGASGTIIER